MLKKDQAGMKRFIALLAFLIGVTGLPVFSAMAGTDGHAGESSGLPQLDPSSFPSQLFWLGIMFTVMYIAFERRILPTISSVIDNRRNHIHSDLTTAEKLKQEAHDVHEAYEESLKGARQEAASIVNGAVQDTSKEFDDSMNAFRQRFEESILQMEAKIDSKRSEIMDEMIGIASEAAIDAAEKLTGKKMAAMDVSVLSDRLKSMGTGDQAKAA